VNLVDSSAWLEYFADGRNAGAFASAIEDVDHLVVSAINCHEVYKHLAQQRDDVAATDAVASMRQGLVIDVTPEIAVFAAAIALETKLPMADSLILATARMHGATVWTQDADFAHVPGVRYFATR
jgi:predicted nucleic acid-binding protein